MKRILSILLALTMILSLSVCAFAAEGDAEAASDVDRLLEAIPMPKDVSVVDDTDNKIHIAKLVDIPDSAKETAKEQIESLKKMGYTIHSGFAIWSDDKDVNFCTIKLAEQYIPESSVVFVNANRIQPETKESDEYFDTSLSEIQIVLIAVREQRPIDSSAPVAAPASGGGDHHYVSPTFVKP